MRLRARAAGAAGLDRRLSERWRWFAYALGGLGVVGLAAVLIAPQLAGLFLLAVYCVPANSIVPVPHEPGVLLVAKYYAPAAVALAATLGSVIASYADYAVVETALRHPAIDRARGRGVIAWSIRMMGRAPFVIIVAFSLIPLLPISIIRALAPASGYSFPRYVLAGLIGRLPRFYLLAYLGSVVLVPTWALIAVTALTLAVAYASAGAGRAPAAAVPEAP